MENYLYKINNDIDNIKKDIIKTIKKEDSIRFHLIKDAFGENSFPYYERKFKDYVINGKDDNMKLIAKHMNIDKMDNYYYIISKYLEIYNDDCDNIFEIRRKRRLLENKYDETIKIKEELEIEINNNKAKKELINKIIIIIIIIYLIIVLYSSSNIS